MTHSPASALVLCLQGHWASASRLPERLAANGLRVGVICPEGALIQYAHPIHQIRTFKANGAWAGFLPALQEAVQAFTPHLILPGDDQARLALHDLHALAAQQHDAPLMALLERSLGDPQHHADVERKSALWSHAVTTGLGAPEGVLPHSLEEALDFAARLQAPVVLKQDFGAGGAGVVRCPDAQTLEIAYQQASARPLPRQGRILVQRWVRGQTISTNFAAWQGEVLAACTSLREHVHPAPFGPVALARHLPDHPAVSLARQVVRDLGLSGLGSLQCLIDGDTGQPLVMELNPRVTPIAIASRAFGVDLIGTLASASRGAPLPAPHPPTHERVALFPNEWQRDPGSPTLTDPGVHHDVPWSQPALLAATVQQAWRHP